MTVKPARRPAKRPPAAAIGLLSALITLMILGALPGGYVQLYVDATLVAVMTAVIAVMLWLSYLFFRSRPLRLLELIIMVATVGNAVGLLSRKLLVDDPAPLKLFVFILLALSSILIASGGAAWGLWTAKSLRKDGTAARALLVLLGIAAPTGAIAFLVAWLHLANRGAALPADERLLAQGVMLVAALIMASTVGMHAYVRSLGMVRQEEA